MPPGVSGTLLHLERLGTSTAPLETTALSDAPADRAVVSHRRGRIVGS